MPPLTYGTSMKKASMYQASAHLNHLLVVVPKNVDFSKLHVNDWNEFIIL